MVLVRSIRQTFGAVTRNPVILFVMGLLTLVQLTQLAAQALNPLVASLISILFTLAYIVVFPYVGGGLFGMADEALDGKTSLGTFHESGKRHYVSMFVAYLLLLAVSIVIGIVLVVVGFAAFFLFFGVSSSTTMLVAIGLLIALVLLGILVGLMFVQFYGQAIVIEDLGGVAGLKRSVMTVRRNLLSVFVYSALVGIFGVVAGGVGAVFSVLVSPPQMPGVPLPELTLPVLLGGAIAYVVLSAVLGAVLLVLSVAFYRALRDRDAATTGSQRGGTATQSA